MARRRAVRQRQTRANEGEQPKNEEAPSASIDPDGASELAGNGNGEGEIRTPATLAGRPVFETGAFNHSATSPKFSRNDSRRRGFSQNDPLDLSDCGSSHIC